MKRVLLVLGCGVESAAPGADCLLAASVVVRAEAGARFLAVAHCGDAASTARVRSAVALLLEAGPGGAKIVYVDTAPVSAGEAEFLLSLDQRVCVYVFDHHDNAFRALLAAAPNVSYSASGAASTSALVSRLHFAAAGDVAWRRVLLLLHVVCFLDIEAVDSLATPDESLAALAEDLRRRYPHGRRLGGDADLLLFVARGVEAAAAAMDWGCARGDGLDPCAVSGLLLDRVLVARVFLDALLAGDDAQLLSRAAVDAHEGCQAAWRGLIAAGRLVSVPLGEKYSARFLGAVLVRPEAERGPAGPLLMTPGLAAALGARSKAQCLLDCAAGAEGGVRVAVHRAAAAVDCLEVALALARLVAPREVTVDGSASSAALVCPPAAFADLQRRLSLSRAAVQLHAARPPPARRSPPPPAARPHRHSLVRKHTSTSLSPNGVPGHARVRPRPHASVGSDSVFE